MTDDYRIYVDANWPATLNDGAGVLTADSGVKPLAIPE